MANQVDYFKEMTPTNWEKAEAVLSGNDARSGVSPKDAARAAGVPLRHFLKWIDRSREKRKDDDPWIWRMAKIYDDRFNLQAQTLESVAFRRAVEGDPKQIWYQGQPVGEEMVYDNKLLMDLLRARDEKYTPKKIELNLTFEPEQIIQRLVALRRIASARAEEENEGITIEGTATPIEVKNDS